MTHRTAPHTTLGPWDLHAISDGLFRLDGGAMFGTVPKVLWDRVKPADELNRIDLCASSLLLRTEGLTVLVEGGIGRKYPPKLASIYGLDPVTSLDEELEALGLGPEDVDHVVLTHLHFDHAGALTVRRDDGILAPHFPRARHHVNAVEWVGATIPHARSQASYVRDDWMPLHDAGLLDVHEGRDPVEIVPGLTTTLVGGHTPGLSIVRLDVADEPPVVYVGDLIPTGAHVPVPWIMSYDLAPVRQVELKEHFLPEWEQEGALVVFPHETRYPWARIGRSDKGAFEALPEDEGWMEPLRRAPWPELPQR